MTHRVTFAVLLATFISWTLSACSHGSSSSPTLPSSSTTSTTTSGTTIFEGTMAGSGGQSATFSITIDTTVAASFLATYRSASAVIKQASNSSAVSGTLNVAGASFSLTGTYDPSTNTVNLTGGGLTCAATIGGGALTGSCNGNPISGLAPPSGGSVTAYCGTYVDGSGGGSGLWNFEVSGALLSGETFPTTNSQDHSLTLTGQVSGSAVSGSSSDGHSFTGTIQNGTVNGTDSSGGTFTGSSGSCALLPPPTPPQGNTGSYVIQVSVEFPFSGTLPSSGEAVAVCATYSGACCSLQGAAGSVCNSSINFGRTGELGSASAGVAYTVSLAGGATTSGTVCSITSVGSGVFGPSMPPAVVSCSGTVLPYTIPVGVAFSGKYPPNSILQAQFCVTSQGVTNCPGSVSGSGQISVNGGAGTPYTVSVTGTGSCSMTAGGSGVFGVSMPGATASCVGNYQPASCTAPSGCRSGS